MMHARGRTFRHRRAGAREEQPFARHAIKCRSLDPPRAVRARMCAPVVRDREEDVWPRVRSVRVCDSRAGDHAEEQEECFHFSGISKRGAASGGRCPSCRVVSTTAGTASWDSSPGLRGALLPDCLKSKERQNRQAEAATHKPDDKRFAGGGDDRNKDECEHKFEWLVVPMDRRSFFRRM